MFQKVKMRLLILVFMINLLSFSHGRIVNKYKCPEVRPVPHFDLTRMLGTWNVVEYYDSDEEAQSLACMTLVFVQDHNMNKDGKVDWTVSMNYTYEYLDDPIRDKLQGNITWIVDNNDPGHWTHTEKEYAGIYNTFVVDTDHQDWVVLLHCAEDDHDINHPELKARYLTAFVLAKKKSLPKNVMAYLRDKLQRYEVDVNYVFPVIHDKCDEPKEPWLIRNQEMIELDPKTQTTSKIILY